MSDQQSIRDDLARTMCEAEDSGTYSEEEGTCSWHIRLADIVLESSVLLRIQAETLRKAGKDIVRGTRRSYGPWDRPVDPDGNASVWLYNEAHRIENGE